MPVTSVYLKLVSQDSGEIRGPSRRRGYEGQIPVIAVNHDIAVPRDLSTNKPSGKRQHHALIITKEVDRTTPLLNQLMVRNAAIKDAELTFLGTDPNSVFPNAENKLYTIKLQNAFISHIELVLPNISGDPKKNAAMIEIVSIVYSKIEWTWTDGDITGQDTWEAGL